MEYDALFENNNTNNSDDKFLSFDDSFSGFEVD